MVLVLLIFLQITSNQLIQPVATQFYTFSNLDLSSWTIRNGPSKHFVASYCGDLIVGGFGNFMGRLPPVQLQKTYSNLVPHYGVLIQFNLYKIDRWENQMFFLQVDGVTVYSIKLTPVHGVSDLCGIQDPPDTSFYQQIFAVSISVAHTSSSLKIMMTSSQHQLGAWGINNLKIQLKRCDYSCASCTTSYACTSCYPGLHLVGSYCQCVDLNAYLQELRQCAVPPCVSCIGGCTEGFSDAVIKVCRSCHVACSACTAATNSPSPICSTCSDNYYRAVPPTSCLKCPSPCYECSGPNPSDCISCLDGYFLEGVNCVTDCPNGTYPYETNKICLNCDPSCGNCMGSTGKLCTSCNVNFLFQNQCLPSCPLGYYRYLDQNACVAACPVGTYVSGTSCLACGIDCELCVAGGCLKCTTGHLHLGSCIVCPSGYYASSGSCLECNTLCNQCYGGSNGQCKGCYLGYRFLDGQCILTCPSSTFPPLCMSCHESCLQCSSQDQFSCSICIPDYYYHLNQSLCLPECAFGQVTIQNPVQQCWTCDDGWAQNFGICALCFPGCKKCWGVQVGQCLQCQEGQLDKGYCIVQYLIYTGNAIQPEDMTVIIFLLIIGILLAVLIQIVFHHKSVLLPFLQFLQLVALSRYFQADFGYKSQTILNFLNYFTGNWYNWELLGQNEYTPFILTSANYGGVYLLDSLVLRIILYLALLMMLFVRFLKKSSMGCYLRMYPLLFGYILRLGMYNMGISMLIFFYYYGQIQSGVMKYLCFGVLMLDLLCLGLSVFWRFRLREGESNIMAVLYDNEIGKGKHDEDQHLLVEQDQLGAAYLKWRIDPLDNQLWNRSSTWGVVPLLFKVCFCLSIVVFEREIVRYSFIVVVSLSLLVDLGIPYRKRYYKMLQIVYKVLALSLYLTIHLSTLQLILYIGIGFYSIVTLIQITSNWAYIISFEFWCFREQQFPNHINQNTRHMNQSVEAMIP